MFSLGNKLHLYHLNLVQPNSVVCRYREMLHTEETERADRFVSEVHRNRFIVTRGALREILADYFDASPHTLRFVYGTHGKPRIADCDNRIGLNFNVSHSGDKALIGVIGAARIGVDLEMVQATIPVEQIAEDFFSPVEMAVLLALPQERRLEAFFACWTRKEAYIKAVGDGLSMSLRGFDVAFAPGETPALLRVEQDREPSGRWKMHIPPVAQGYAAAVVFEDMGNGIDCQDWSIP